MGVVQLLATLKQGITVSSALSLTGAAIAAVLIVVGTWWWYCRIASRPA